MPRNASGEYTLPAGNPVVSNTLIEIAWANPTMSDIGAALTDSLDRYGRGGMLAAFKIADGIVTAPGLSFLSQSNMGLYRAGPDQFGFSVGAAQKLMLNATVAAFSVLVRTGADTAAAPGFSWVADSNKGIWSPGSNRIGFTTAGVQRWEFTASGILASGSETTVVPAVGGTAGRLNIPGLSENGSTVVVTRWDANSAGPGLSLGKSRGAAVGDFTPVIAGDVLGNIIFAGADGVQMSNNNSSALIRAIAAETFTPTKTGGILEFVTDAIGTNLGVQRLSLDGIRALFSVPIYALDGTDTAPVYSFASQPGQGFYRAGSGLTGHRGDLLVNSSGDAQLTIRSLGTGTDDDANVVIDAYDNDGEPGIFLRQGGVDRLTIGYSTVNEGTLSVGGTQNFQFTATQNLSIVGTVTNPGYSFIGDTDTGFFRVAANEWGIAAGGITRVRQNANVHVCTLIPTTVPVVGNMVNQEMCFSRNNDTNIRISMRGADGVLRHALIPIA